MSETKVELAAQVDGELDELSELTHEWRVIRFEIEQARERLQSVKKRTIDLFEEYGATSYVSKTEARLNQALDSVDWHLQNLENIARNRKETEGEVEEIPF